MLIVATPRLLAIDPGPFMNSGPTLRGFFTCVDEADRYARSVAGSSLGEDMRGCRWVIPWRDVTELSAIQPWPSMRISFRSGQGLDTRTLRPRERWFGRSLDDDAQWEEVIVALFDRAKSLGLRVPIRPGWSAFDHVPWEDVDDWPEHALASRSKPSSLEFLFAWWASGPRQPWSMTARDVAVTPDFVYAHLAGGRTARLPLSALRDGWSSPRGDRVYEFGRRTLFVLPARDHCAVQRLLDENLPPRV